MRYRDPDFDIDWDLKWEKGYCLNGLGDSKFDISGRAFSNPTSNVPKAVKRVHEIFEKPTFLKEKISPADVKQGSLGDCWLMASLTALANMEVGIQRICVEYDTKIGIYGFVFHRDGEWIISIIDDKLYLKSPDWDSPSVQRHLLEQTDKEDVEKAYRETYQTGSQSLFFAQCKDQNETWLPLLEKAFAKAHGDYAALAGGWIGEGVEDLTGGVTTELLTSDILDTDEFWNNEIMKVNKEFLFGCSTGLLGGGYGSRDGISEGHAYVIMEAREISTGQRLLKLRNPWGKGKKGNWEGAWSDGSKEFTPEIQLELNHQFGKDSVFWIEYKDLLRKYQHFDRTRLFMDSPDWRITQKWISMEVPWKAEFEQKFRIVLTKESPVVLVLSQLDDRYFNGLQGQYNFRLQFRLHEVNSPEENEYIVRSHGNYLMERSVVTELKELPPGTYSVFIQIVADRNTIQPSVEDVIKYQTRRRTENEKLAQVGMSYDLAHSKGAVYMESKAARRKAQDKAKAREARIATRRKNWEKRHLSRDIMRKQDRKNREKRERKEARDDAEAKEREEKEPKDQAVQTEDVVEISAKQDKSMQTDDRGTSSSAESEQTIKPPAPVSEELKDTDKGVQTDDISIADFSQCTPDTPNGSSLASPREEVIILERSSSGPPPPQVYIRERKHSTSPDDYTQNQHQRQQYITSDGESSASPISDFDDMYSDDDPTLRPRPATNTGTPATTSKSKDRDEDEDDEPDPWNAVCIVGFRVYSKDEGLMLRHWEGDEVEEIKTETPEKEDNGTDADVEDGDEVPKEEKKTDESKKDEPSADGGKSELPIKSDSTKELVLVDQEKKSMHLGAEDSETGAPKTADEEPDEPVSEASATIMIESEKVQEDVSASAPSNP